MIKEIDDLIEDSDVEEEDLSEHGNQVTVEANLKSKSLRQNLPSLMLQNVKCLKQKK